MSITVAAKAANQHFAEILGKAEAGETVVITKHGVPIATLGPYRSEAASPERRAAWDRIIARLGTVPVPPEGWAWSRDELYDDENGNPRGTPKVF